MPLIKVKRHCQITLPSLIRKKFNIGEGDYLEIEERDGTMVLKPVKVVDVKESSLKTSRES